MSANTNMIQLSVSLEPPVLSLDGHTSIVHQLPLGGLGCLGNQSLVSWVRVDDEFGVAGILEGLPQLLDGVARISSSVLRL
jgi:hypothetical protein